MLNKLLIVSLLSMLVGACSSTNSHKGKRVQIYQDYINSHQLEAKDAVINFRFNNWKSLDYQHLILSASSKKHYLITLKYYCNDLRSAHTIALDQSMNSRLSAKFDSIIVPTEFKQKCRISSIHQLDNEQEKEVLALSRNQKNKE